MFVRDIEHGADHRHQVNRAPPTNWLTLVSSGCCARSPKHTNAPGRRSHHTHAGLRRRRDQQRIFAEEGWTWSRVVIGHCGDSTDVGYLEELTAPPRDGPVWRRRDLTVSGPGEHRGPNAESAAMPTRWCYHTTPAAISTRFPRSWCRVATPNWHYLHPQRRHPRTEQHSVTDEQLHTMLVDNPRRT